KCVMTTSIICTCSLFLKSCQMINVFSKLKPVEGARVFWSGSVYGDNHVNETQVFQKKTDEIPTTDMDLFCN
uniref:Uncharacterized protein n=1 Tax=Cyprinus carpio carpio TaxID=630221 RepID=A0A9J7YMF9_CYPCA